MVQCPHVVGLRLEMGFKQVGGCGGAVALDMQDRQPEQRVAVVRIVAQRPLQGVDRLVGLPGGALGHRQRPERRHERRIDRQRIADRRECLRPTPPPKKSQTPPPTCPPCPPPPTPPPPP